MWLIFRFSFLDSIFEMTLFVKMTFLLTISLTCLSPFGAAYTLIPGIAINENCTIPQRLEIRTFIQNTTRCNIYLIALERMQQMRTDQPLSYYRISAIHGTNLIWNNDTGGNYLNGNGYCYHGDKLFLPWHRPYISLYEKTLLDLATTIVEEFPAGIIKSDHLATLATWRMPYWDWAMNASIPGIMSRTTVSVRRMQNGTLTTVTIPNPLASYCFQIPNDRNTVIVPSICRTIQTVRNPIVQNNMYVTQADLTNSRMIGIESDLKSGVYDALTLATDYNSFSNTAAVPFSIAGVHNVIHMAIGGDQGHMTDLNFAAFDPIFYLHHGNIDRLFAMWQALHPDSYLSDYTLEFPNEETELHPFRKTDSQYWTPKLARNITAFGYTYPELVNFDQQTVSSAVNELYGPTTPSSGRRRRASTTSDLVRSTSTLLNTTHDEYRALIQIFNTAGNGPFLVCFFLGEPSSDDSNFTVDPNFVGLFAVFASGGMSRSHNKLIRRAVSLTDALNERIATKQLQDTSSKAISAYLRANLQLRIVGSQSKNVDLTGFQIDVVTAKLNMPSDSSVLPVWGKFESIYKATEVELASKTKFLPISSGVSVVDEIDITDSPTSVDDLASSGISTISHSTSRGNFSVVSDTI